MKSTYRGSCHCGAIKFEADLDLDEGIRKCNCSFCLKLGYKKSFAAYDGLRVVEAAVPLREYLPEPSHWPEGDINHYYCPHCANHVFSRGFLDEMGGEFWAVNVACLDDAEEALGAAPIIYEDGKRDRQLETPAITSYL